MIADFIHKTERPWPNRRLKIAAVIGHTTATTARVWARTGAPGKFHLLHFSANSKAAAGWFERQMNEAPFPVDKAPANAVVATPFETTWETDATCVVDVTGLAPGSEWRYALCRALDGRVILGHDKKHSFMTPSSDMGEFRFGLFSCHMPFKKGGLFSKKTEVVNMDAWDIMCDAMRHRRESAKDLDFVIAGGDQCYADGVPTLDIWKHLNKVMHKDKSGKLTPSTETMVNWYRDIYRGYWGFYPVRRVFSSFPTYMIWDDHELGDGWGSYKLPGELGEIFPALKERGLSNADGKELLRRMESAAKRVYVEYQHSHNPPTPEGQFDYAFRHKGSEFYVLDGRGYRDINRSSFRILGESQFRRFKSHVDALNPRVVKHLFVVSAVPVLHMREAVVDRAEGWTMDRLNLTDDLRDAWEHSLHDKERKALMRVLFDAAAKGIKVAILSGDVHVSAAFKISDGKGCDVFQLTSSAITYNVSTPLSWILKAGVPDKGETKDGYKYERLALYAEPSYSVVRVNPSMKDAVFQIYGKQTIRRPSRPLKAEAKANSVRKHHRDRFREDGQEEFPVRHSIAKIPLR